MSTPTRADVEELVRQHAAADPEFRSLLLSDPRAAILDLVGIEIPELVTIEVHEESLTHVHLVLPPVPGTGELSEEELELAAGGASWVPNASTDYGPLYYGPR